MKSLSVALKRIISEGRFIVRDVNSPHSEFGDPDAVPITHDYMLRWAEVLTPEIERLA